MSNTTTIPAFITPQALLDHWQGHRRLTRRVIDAFPEEQLFTFSIGSMRPFGALALGASLRLAALHALELLHISPADVMACTTLFRRRSAG